MVLRRWRWGQRGRGRQRDGRPSQPATAPEGSRQGPPRAPPRPRTLSGAPPAAKPANISRLLRWITSTCGWRSASYARSASAVRDSGAGALAQSRVSLRFRSDAVEQGYAAWLAHVLLRRDRMSGVLIILSMCRVALYEVRCWRVLASWPALPVPRGSAAALVCRLAFSSSMQRATLLPLPPARPAAFPPLLHLTLHAGPGSGHGAAVGLHLAALAALRG